MTKEQRLLEVRRFNSTKTVVHEDVLVNGEVVAVGAVYVAAGPNREHFCREYIRLANGQ